MKKTYTRKQIAESIAYWKKVLKESYDTPFLHDAHDNGAITTVGDLKRILSKFKDSDVIDICDQDGVPGSAIAAIWNSSMEYDMTGEDDGRDGICYIRVTDEDMLNEGFTDTRLPHDRVRRHETGIPEKYWVAIEQYSELLTNNGSYVNLSLQQIPVANNNVPPSTTDLDKAIALAKRAQAKWPNRYVMIGKDTTSRGVMTQKNHLRGGSTVDCWLPDMKYWRDGVVG